MQHLATTKTMAELVSMHYSTTLAVLWIRVTYSMSRTTVVLMNVP